MPKLIKPCSESEDLRRMRSLNSRMILPDKEIQYYLNLEKGFEGEQKFENLLLQKLSSEYLILNDLLFEVNNTAFQIDSILISQYKIQLFEVKNYKGDFYINKDNWYKISGKEIKNPADQLKRSTSLFRQLLHDLHLNFEVEAYLIFVNPEFTLYQAPLNLPIIFPAQINRFMDKLNLLQSNLNGKQSKLAEQLISVSFKKSPFKHSFTYDYDLLTKGIICGTSKSFLTPFNQRKLLCPECRRKVDIESAVLRNVEEFHLLFPSRKITTPAIHVWCNEICPLKTIRRILTKHFKVVFQGKQTYYVLPEDKHN